MLLSAHKELKEEIKALPEKEKDKLLLRLIAKDKVLTEHLHFKLLENEEDLAARQEALTSVMDEVLSQIATQGMRDPKSALSQFRKLISSVNHHAKVTKDAVSAFELKLHLLLQVPLDYKVGRFSAMSRFSEKLSIYFIKAVASLLTGYRKLHEDIQYDLKDDMNALLLKAAPYKDVIHTAAPLPDQV
ncbi:hypothetical protein [Pedobacter faecalis]|uniref:hypothetical protein n=1 Tax=Pedobacter faecalis TaxID=3041495 RepID=UPI00254B5F21|nr:hypothetical protein [Pedobacter sp. ELA7]